MQDCSILQLIDMVEPVNVVHIVFAFVSVFGIVLLIDQRRLRALIYLLAVCGLSSIFNLLEETNITRPYYLITPAFTLLFGPLFYFVIRQFTDSENSIAKPALVHFIPFAIALGFTSWPQWVLMAGTISEIAYWFASLLRVRRFHRACLLQNSDAYGLRLQWLLTIIAVYIGITLIDLPRLNLQPYLNPDLRAAWYLLTQFAYLLLICILIVRAIKQPELFSAPDLALTRVEDYSHTSPYSETEQRHFDALDKLIRNERLYRQPRLSLREVAEGSGYNERELSRIINMGSSKNFCDYINGLRIEEVKAVIRDKAAKDQNILDIAMAAGFNSKSTFNAVFKQETGMTPSQFKVSQGPET